jgi:hypothetical protein
MGRAVAAALAASALALALAPAVLPASYSWVAHTTSEAAAQGVPGAWLARAGFLVFGLAVLALASLRHWTWGSVGAGLHGAFGVMMIAAGVFSSRSWEPSAPFDVTEDLLHSVAATAMGFAFAFWVAACGWAWVRRHGRVRARDIAAVIASLALPLGMAANPSTAGLLQRAMFSIAYLWYGAEALRPPRAPEVVPDTA